jgi:hypothetical protein
MKRIVVHGMKESGWFADNPTNPHVPGATAAGGEGKGGNVSLKLGPSMLDSEVNGGDADAIPKAFTIEGRDTSKAKITPAEAIQAEIEWRGPSQLPAGVITRDTHDILVGAGRRIVMDHLARSEGSIFVSKYPGHDSVTGKRFDAGTTIFYRKPQGLLNAIRRGEWVPDEVLTVVK